MIEYRVYTEDLELLITSLSGLRPAPTGIILYVYYLFRSCTRFVSKGLVWKLGDDPAWRNIGNHVRTPDLSSIMQEVINRDNWKPGQAVDFLFGHMSGNGVRWVQSAHDSYATALHFEYLYWSGSGWVVPSVDSPTEIQGLVAADTAEENTADGSMCKIVILSRFACCPSR